MEATVEEEEDTETRTISKEVVVVAEEEEAVGVTTITAEEAPADATKPTTANQSTLAKKPKNVSNNWSSRWATTRTQRTRNQTWHA